MPCASGKCNAGKCEPLVFVSLQTLKGNFGASGDPGFLADQKCGAEGKLLAPLSTFFAWLGGASTPSARGLRMVQRPYWTPGLSGPVLMANNAASLASSPLLAPVGRRDGTAAVAPPWTNVTASGLLVSGANETCSVWIDGTFGGRGAIGAPTSAAAGFWAAHLTGTIYQVGGCDVLRPVVCVEDVTP